MKAKKIYAFMLSAAIAVTSVFGLSHVTSVEAASADKAKLPTKYDLRDDGYVTPVKYQNPFGSCWGFGGIAAAETSILSASGQTYEDTVKSGNPLDLSEKHLVWFAMHPITASEDETQVGEGMTLLSDDPNAAYDNCGSNIFPMVWDN